MKKSNVTYAIIYENNSETMFRAKTDCYLNDKHVIPTGLNENHKYILFKRRCYNNSTERYIGAVTSDDLEMLSNMAADKFTSYFNYPKKFYINSKGERVTIS